MFTTAPSKIYCAGSGVSVLSPTFACPPILPPLSPTDEIGKLLDSSYRLYLYEHNCRESYVLLNKAFKIWNEQSEKTSIVLPNIAICFYYLFSGILFSEDLELYDIFSSSSPVSINNGPNMIITSNTSISQVTEENSFKTMEEKLIITKTKALEFFICALDKSEQFSEAEASERVLPRFYLAREMYDWNAFSYCTIVLRQAEEIIISLEGPDSVLSLLVGYDLNCCAVTQAQIAHEIKFGAFDRIIDHNEHKSAPLKTLSQLEITGEYGFPFEVESFSPFMVPVNKNYNTQISITSNSRKSIPPSFINEGNKFDAVFSGAVKATRLIANKTVLNLQQGLINAPIYNSAPESLEVIAEDCKRILSGLTKMLGMNNTYTLSAMKLYEICVSTSEGVLSPDEPNSEDLLKALRLIQARIDAGFNGNIIKFTPKILKNTEELDIIINGSKEKGKKGKKGKKGTKGKKGKKSKKGTKGKKASKAKKGSKGKKSSKGKKGSKKKK